ncbi:MULTISPECIES: hypothetical protein [unclassified Microbacterium]|uniref:hypothetical protein n=1 Tax=unclassified Microbacterium TaxID=2609290 RepID=UPI000C2C32F9|nr:MULTISPECIES: hypothetical protein [unclassified Microbacterium]
MTSSRDDLPEGVINADPTGGWQSGETEERVSDELVAPDAPIEGAEAGQAADPDLSDDADSDGSDA